MKSVHFSDLRGWNYFIPCFMCLRSTCGTSVHALFLQTLPVIVEILLESLTL